MYVAFFEKQIKILLMSNFLELQKLKYLFLVEVLESS